MDPVAGQGPLRGVLTALENATTSIVAVTTVDMPNVRGAHLQWLAAQLHDAPNTTALMLRREAEVEPFPAAYRASAAGAICAQLDANRLSVRALTGQAGFDTVPAPRRMGRARALDKPQPSRGARGVSQATILCGSMTNFFAAPLSKSL
jgi:molybdopterin-guanine dinucleotide biosynthesis protein A